MKKNLIGAIVGGLIIFIAQTLSWTVLDLHRPANQYTPKQDSIMAYLNSQFSEDGQYYLPNTPTGASGEEMEKLMNESAGKPWAVVTYHKAMNMSMGMNMARGVLVDIVMVWLLCWMLAKFSNNNFVTTLTACLFIGLIVFMNAPYTGHIWYPSFDLTAYLIDYLVGWGLCGLWLGLWLNRR
jgi:glycerol uptake facilitator-like aquaporin